MRWDMNTWAKESEKKEKQTKRRRATRRLFVCFSLWGMAFFHMHVYTHDIPQTGKKGEKDALQEEVYSSGPVHSHMPPRGHAGHGVVACRGLGQAAVSGAAEEGIHDVEAGWEAQSEAGGGTEEESLWEEGVLEEEPCGTAAQAEEGAPSISLAQEGAITYTGQEIEPQLTVEYGGTMLMPGVDYETSFENNIRAGTATAHVKGIGACLFEEDFDLRSARTSSPRKTCRRTSGNTARATAAAYPGRTRMPSLSGT